MRITILRHGIPDLSEWNKIYSSGMHEWIEAYNNAEVKNENPQPCQEMLRKFSHKFIVCSNLKRSTQSAKIIGYQSPHLIDGIFCEAELPKIQLPFIRLTPDVWSMVFRFFWIIGVSPNAESLEKFKPRVSLAAEKLIQLAKNHSSVLLIGHGIINRFLAKELVAKGWQGEEASNGNKYWGYKYWEYTTYTKNCCYTNNKSAQ